MKLINLNKIVGIQIAKKGADVFVVFQDGRHNFGVKAESMDDAERLLGEIECGRYTNWLRVPGEIVQVVFKKDISRIPEIKNGMRRDRDLERQAEHYEKLRNE